MELNYRVDEVYRGKLERNFPASLPPNKLALYRVGQTNFGFIFAINKIPGLPKKERWSDLFHKANRFSAFFRSFYGHFSLGTPRLKFAQANSKTH